MMLRPTCIEIIAESADLLFHLLILWSDQDISVDEALGALRARRGVSGLDEKKARPEIG